MHGASARLAVAVTAGFCVGLSILVEVIDLDPSIGNRRFHVALETADAVLLVFLASVILGRFRSDGSRRNLWLLTAAVVLAAKNLFHAGAAIGVDDDIAPGHFAVWAVAVNGVIGAFLVAASALLPDRQVRRARSIPLVLLRGSAIVVGGVLVAIALQGPLPDAFPELSESTPELDIWSGHPLKIVVDLATGACYAVAAVAFARHADHHGDEFMKWLSIGSVTASVAFVNYAMWPSRFSQLLYGGELMWIFAIGAFLYGAVREISNLEAALVRSAVREERKRVARDLHDGVVQELSYIASQTRWLLGRPMSDRVPLQMARTLDAVERALDESRGAIAALNREMDEPLELAVGHAASDVADRVGGELHLDLEPQVEVSIEWRDALIRIAREAVGNAVRHGHARQVTLALRNGAAVRMRVIDDGEGFDVTAPRSKQSFGLQSMRERTESLGGQFRITSAPGKGTIVDVILP